MQMIPTGEAVAQSTFNRDLWMQPVEYGSKSTQRLDMVRDVMVKLPAGLPQPEVQSLLGNPDERFDLEWVYYLGAGAIPIEGQLLVVFFAPDGKVSSVREVRGEAYVAPKKRG